MTQFSQTAHDARPATQVESELSEIHKAIQKHEEIVAHLHSRLVKVLVHKPEAYDEEMPPKVLLVPLANEIRMAREKVEALTNTISEIIDDIQL